MNGLKPTPARVGLLFPRSIDPSENQTRNADRLMSILIVRSSNGHFHLQL